MRDFKNTNTYKVYQAILQMSTVNLPDLTTVLDLNSKSVRMAVWRLIHAGMVKSSNEKMMADGAMFSIRRPYTHQLIIDLDQNGKPRKSKVVEAEPVMHLEKIKDPIDDLINSWTVAQGRELYLRLKEIYGN